MAPRGHNVKKGQRPGGRKRGTPNRKTLEAILRAEIATDAAKRQGLRLAVDVLSEYMHLFHGEAEKYRPTERMRGAKITPREQKFLGYAKLTVDTAKDLASYQSAKLKAVMVSLPPPGPTPPLISQDGQVIQINDPVALARVYQRLVKAVK